MGRVDEALEPLLHLGARVRELLLELLVVEQDEVGLVGQLGG